MNTPQDRKLNLHQRINEVRKTNDYIKKEKTVTGAGYKAVTHDQVTAELRADLITHGVLVCPSIVAGTHRVVDTGTKTKSDIPFIRLEADVSVAFINVDDPQDREVLVIPAHAIDQGDKAPGKLVSYAVKYAMLKIFSIETGEDDEGRQVERDGANTMTPKELADWKVVIDAIGTEQEAAKAWQDKIVPRCREVGDKSAYTQLQSAITVRVARIRKVSKAAADAAAEAKAKAGAKAVAHA